MRARYRTRRESDTLAPDGSEIRVLIGGERAGIRRASVCEVTLPAGQASRPIAHRSVEEVWYILAGRGEVWRQLPGEEGGIVAVAPGDCLAIPTGCRFQFRAPGPEPLVFLCVTMPPWPGPDEAIPLVSGAWPVDRE